MNFNSYELTEFNLKKDEHINLHEKRGLIKIMRVDDGKLILMKDAGYGVIDHSRPTPASVADTEAMLGFVMDIGVRREVALTPGGSGAYLPSALPSQSEKVISQADYDKDLMDQIDAYVDGGYQSGDADRMVRAVKINHLLEAYNDARLMFPNFYNESYLGLMRILDALVGSRAAIGFACAVAKLNPTINSDVLEKVSAVAGLADRADIAKSVYDSQLLKARVDSRLGACVVDMEAFDGPAKFIFGCIFSAYQYRNKFVHVGLPFPDTVKQSFGLADGSGMAFLHPAQGASFILTHRPDGIEAGDTLDIHCIISDEREADEFKEKYFKLVPTWHFMKCLVRSALFAVIAETNT